MADGRQQQDQTPQQQRRRPGLQPYQPRQHPQQQPTGGGRGRGPQTGRGGAGRQPQAQGSTGSRSARGGATAQQPSPAAAPLPLAVDALVEAASDTSHPEAARVAALQQLHQQLFNPAAQRAALQQLQVLWPRLLNLLWEDPSPAVTAATAPGVGAIGALTSQAAAAAASQRESTGGSTASASSAGGLLFDWLLPVLQRRAAPGGHVLVAHQLSAVLLAVRDCLAGVDAVTLARYANAVLGACQALLEDVKTPPAAVPALLATLQQAARHPHALKARCRDLTDLLLGWALEPALPDAARPALVRLLAASVGAQRRQEQPGFLAALLDSLLADMQGFVDKASAAACIVQGSPADSAAEASGAADSAAAIKDATNSLRQVLALAACVLPLLDAAAASRLPSTQQHLEAVLCVVQHAAETAAAASDAAAAAGLALSSPAVAPGALVVELSGHVARLAALAPAVVSAAVAGSRAAVAGTSIQPEQQQQEGEQEAGAGDEVLAAMQQLDLGEQAGATASTGQPVPRPAGTFKKGTAPATTGSGTETAQQAASMQQLFAGVAGYAASAAGLTGVLAQPTAVLALLGALRSWVQVLAAQAIPLGPAAELLLPPHRGWLLGLRCYGSREVVLHVAQLLLPVLQHSPAAVDALLTDAELQAAQLQAGAGGVRPTAAAGEPPDIASGSPQAAAAATPAAAALQFDLQLLHAAIKQLPQDLLHSVWQRLLPLAQPTSHLAAVSSEHPDQPPHRLRLSLLRLVQAAAQHAVDSWQQSAGSIQQEAFALLASTLQQHAAAPEQVLLQTLRWLGQAAAWPAAAASAEPPGSSCSSRDASTAALQAALACCEVHQAEVRTAALRAVQAWVESELGSCLLLSNASAAGAVLQAALLHLSDLHPPAASAAEQLLVTAAAPLAFRGAYAPCASSLLSSTAAAAIATALQPQQLGFTSAQLRQWLDYLEGSDRPAAVLTAAGQQAAPPLSHWLPHLLYSMRAVPPPGEQGSDPKSNHQCWRLPSTLPQAAWWAVQEAAKQLVAGRLRTHHGGPAQTLAALERAVQSAASRLHLEGAEGEAVGSADKQQAAVLLLLFLFALEQGIACAAAGCGSSRAEVPQTAAIFFAANDKVCQAWFARLRLPLAKAAAAAGLHELAIYHALRRMRDLQQQVASLVPDGASQTVPAVGTSSDATALPAGAGGQERPPALPETPLAGKQERRLSAGQATGSEAANPAAALLAATRGSPDMALRQGLQSAQTAPGSPAAAARSRHLSQQQLQAAAAKVAAAAALAASALCALGDADGIAGLQAFCQQAFQPLLQQLQSVARASPEAASPVGDADASAAAAAAAADAATAAWEWLAAVQLQAAGQYEAAAQQYMMLFGPAAQSGMQCVPATVLARLAAEAYASVGDSQGLASWLQGKVGSRLPQEAAARCLQLASWDNWDRQGSGGPTKSLSLQQLRLATFDPTASACSNSVAHAAGQLAALVAAGGHGRETQQSTQLQLQMHFAQLHSGVAAQSSGSEQSTFCSWHLPDAVTACAVGSCSLHQLPALLQLLSNVPFSQEQRQPLLVAAAQTAMATGNRDCAARLLSQEAAQYPAASSEGVGSHCKTQLWLRLLRLQADPAEADSAQAWQLLLAARSSDAADAHAVAPASAQLLLSQQAMHASLLVSLPPAEVAGQIQSCLLPGLGAGSAAAVAALEQQLLAGQHERQAAQAAEYAALKAAVAAVPAAASTWCLLADWMASLQQQHQLTGSSLTAAAGAASFVASCQALALAGAGSAAADGGSLGPHGYAALPTLLIILRQLCQPGASLPADAAAQLAAVPAVAWLPVVPHLLSQLAAPASEAASQQLVLELLLRIGTAAPCQVMLPALVADVASGTASAGVQPPGPASTPLEQLLQSLRQQQPQLAQQLAVLTREAAGLAVLPEEHWHTVLQEAAATAARRLQQQQQQQQQQDKKRKEAAAGAAADERRSAAGFAALAPVLLCLQQQLEVPEAAAAETPHERRFQQQQQPKLRQLVKQLAEQAAEQASETGSQSQQQSGAVKLLRSAAADMSAALRQRQLALADVAPALASLSDTRIPIPGAAPGPAGVPELVGVAAEVSVLATKTRPKRLRFLGSDGQEHAFLLKGREDLRADACLMHTLRACHAALQAPGAGCGSNGGDLAVHCFEITPLGSRLGLVQWVEDAVPLYELYTGWQQAKAQRQRWLAAAAAQQHQHQQQQASVPAAHAARSGRVIVAPRSAGATGTKAVGQRPAAAQQHQQQRLGPIDLFYAKLKEAGIDPASPRPAWPLPKLVRVLRRMQQSVDRQLLWRELWLGSGGAADLWARQRSFAASTAAMSMVGHLLGLGDRHLDNMLLHRRGGHLVHIDFSVVFDRGLQLKVPEVVPFRLTQTLVEALGVAGPEGRFRVGCERTLHMLRANAAPLFAVLEAALLDSRVDWDAEAAAKAASKAFTWAVALQLFALRQAGAASELEAAAGAAGSALSAANAALAGYVQQFVAMARTAASAAESHSLLQRCRATLDTAAAQEQQLAAQEKQGRAGLASVLAEAQPVAAQVLAALEECQAWQQRHEALLPLLLGNPPAALLLGAPCWDPAAAAAAGAAPPLLLVSSVRGGSGDVGAGSILHGALGMLPSHAPLSTSLLLQAAAVDSQGQQLLQEQAAAATQLAAALQEFGAAAACLLGGLRYAGSSQHAHWLAAFLAAMELPVPQGFEQAAQLAPQPPDPSAALAAWQPVAAAATAACGLPEQLRSTAAALQLERVDVALAASDAQQRLLEAAEGCWAVAATGGQAAESSAASLSLAFAALSEEQALGVLQLQRLADADLEEAAGTAGAAPNEAPAVLEGVQRLVLGYASTAVAVRDATSEELFGAADGGSLLDWLAHAVQAVDSLSTVAAEAQLLLPQLLALLHTEAAAGEVSAAVAVAAEQLGAGSDATGEEQAAAAAMQPLLEAAAQHAPFSALLQCLQRSQTAAQLLLPAEQQPSLAQLQLLLAGSVVAAWQGLEDALEDAAEQAEQAAPSNPAAAAVAAAASSALWQQCSAVLSAAIAAEAEQHLLPQVAAGLSATAEQLRAAAPSLARRSGLGASTKAAAAAPADGGANAVDSKVPDLVPFTAFDDRLPGAGELLGSLEDELGPASSPAGKPYLTADHGAGPAAELVPFLDFDETLAGAGDLLESLEPASAEFKDASPAGSQPQLSQPGAGGSLSQRSDEWECGTDSQPGHAISWRQLAALMAASAEASGALAAVDAVQYVSGLALQQARQLRQQHCSELAACQWANEHRLPAEAAAAAASLLSTVPLSAAAAAAAGAAPPPVHPAVAAWSLHSSRQQVLQRLQAGAATLLSLEAPLQQWQRSLAAVQQQLADEVAAAMPFAIGDLQQTLAQQQQWLAAAAAHIANLLEVAQAVLQLEASRAADAAASPAAAAAGLEEQHQPAGGQPADRYSADQREGWQRYMALLQQMQQLHGAYTAADRSIAASAGELQQLALRRQEATAIAQSAEEAGSSAAAAFAASALPLVKATQQLPTAVAQLLPRLAGTAAAAEQLTQSQRWAVEVAAAATDDDAEVGKAAAAAAEQLAAAAACARQLPAAVQQLQAALLPVRNRLLAGKRSEAAAQQQAADVVDALSAAVTELQPQLEQAERLQQWLAALPASLQGLASQAASQAAALQSQYGFSLQGLQQLLEGQVGIAGASSAPSSRAASTRALSGSLLLTARPPQQLFEERQLYATSVLRRFQAKLQGQERTASAEAAAAARTTAAAGGHSVAGGATSSLPEAIEAEVSAEVGRLIAEATSPDNLARMWEGWMAWV